MDKLAYTHNGLIVTNSKIIATQLGRNHSDVLRTIRNLKCAEGFRLSNFIESSYFNKSNQQQPMYIVTKAGFLELVRNSAKKYEDVITLFLTRFKELSEAIKPVQTYTATKHSNKIYTGGGRVSGGQLVRIRKEINYRVRTLKDRGYVGATHQVIYRAMHLHFDIERYSDLPESKFLAAIDFINSWYPEEKGHHFARVARALPSRKAQVLPRVHDNQLEQGGLWYIYESPELCYLDSVVLLQRLKHNLNWIRIHPECMKTGTDQEARLFLEAVIEHMENSRPARRLLKKIKKTFNKILNGNKRKIKHWLLE